MATATAKPDVATLRRLYHGEKLTVAAIADDLGVAASTVHNWLVAAGVTRRPSPATRRTNLSDRQIVRLYTDDGHTAAEIAERLGCSVSLVYARLAHAGVPRRSRAPRRRVRPDDGELAACYSKRGHSLRQMAQHYGVSPEAVHGWLIAAGIPRRPPRTPPASGDGDNIVNLYRGGWSGPAIAEQLGCSVATIYRRLDAAGVPRRHVTRRLGRSDLLDGLERGLSAPAIAAAHGVSVSCVCRALAREQLMSRTQAFKRQRRLRYTEFYATGLNPNANVSVSGDAQP